MLGASHHPPLVAGAGGLAQLRGQIPLLPGGLLGAPG